VREYQEYARELRPLLPPEAFRTNPDRLALVLINLAILGLGWGLAQQLDRWPLPWLPLFLPFALVMGNSIVVLLFASHDLLHGNAPAPAALAPHGGPAGPGGAVDAPHPLAGGP
jgi:fatty acid desaturase